ncbi:MAG: VOC family protein [Thermoplasmatota archaeon]
MAAGIYALLNVKDVTRTLRFYHALGFKTTRDHMGTFHWGSVWSGDHTLLVFPRKFKGADPAATKWATGNVGRGVLLNLGVKSAKSSFAKAKKAHAKIDMPLDENPWGGHSFTVRDPDGYYVNVSDKFP